MRCAAIIVGTLLLASLTVGSGEAEGQKRIGNVVPPTVPRLVEQASLRPLDGDGGEPAPALPPDLPPQLLPQDLGSPLADGPEKQEGPRERDPFRPFTLDLRPRETVNEAFLTPLQRYDLQQLTVVGVLLDLEPPRAMVQDDAGMGYIVTPGTFIGRRNGVVTDVQHRQIIVEETYVDFYGREQVNKAVLTMPKDEEATAR